MKAKARRSGPTWATFVLYVTGAVLAGAFFVVCLGPDTEGDTAPDTRGPQSPLNTQSEAYSVRSGERFEKLDVQVPDLARAGKPAAAALVPTTLSIPVIDVTTPLVRLGLRRDRTVEVPSNADHAGWFGRGPAPGELGSSVILGHVDSEDGPAVFARLNELARGDSIRVRSRTGRSLRFVVMRLTTYRNADFPAARVYARPGARRLNLVTCAGEFDTVRGGYQENLVVYTRRAARQP